MAQESPADSPYAMPMAMSSCPYPYGLRINLSQEQLKALGYSDLPPAGTTLHLEATGVVTRASSEDPDADGDIDYLCVEIQITEMGVEETGLTAGEDADGDSAGKANRMYGKTSKAA